MADEKFSKGMLYKPIKKIQDLDGQACDLEHTPGTVMLIDFWATWCPPCQGPMGHNQEMLEQNAGTWGENGDKVLIVGISIDMGIDVIKKRVDDKGWHKVKHYWTWENGLKEWDFPGIPHMALIDKCGRIVQKGHPSSFPVEDEINRLLAQSVEECSADVAIEQANAVQEQIKVPAEKAKANLKCENGEKIWKLTATGTKSGWAWDVNKIRFIDADGKTVKGVICSSGSASDGPNGIEGYGPEEAFNNPNPHAAWGGRKDASDCLWIGMKFTAEQQEKIASFELVQMSDSHFTEHVVLTKCDDEGCEPIHEAKVDRGEMNCIDIPK